MTQEEKAKAYDEVVARISKAVGDGLVSENFGRDMLGIAESEDERIRKDLIESIKIGKRTGITFTDAAADKFIAWLEKQKINTEGDFGRGYNCGYEACLNSHGAEWFEKQKEQRPVNVDLDNASQDYVYNHFCSGADFTPDYIKGLMEDAFVDGANWQREPKPGTTENNPINPFDTKLFQDGVKEGRRLEREDMQKERKPTSGDSEKPNNQWSGEDEDNLKRAINICINDFGDDCETAKFLKSLPERFNLQPKQEWSEEDETAFGDLMWCIEQARKSAKDENDMGNIWFAENWLKNRLKSLRPSWKPSDEQIDALDNARFCKSYDRGELDLLYEQLKKLM